MSNVSADKLIAAVEQADSSDRLIAAVRTLAAARLEAAMPTLIAVLGYNNPGAAVAAIEGLVHFGTDAVVPLLEQIDDYDYGARAYSIRALAAIADPRALEILLSAAETDFAPSVRRAAAKGLGHLHWHLLPIAQVADAQAQVLQVLLRITQDADWAIRYAAVVGLQALVMAAPAAMPTVLTRFEQMQTDSELTVQARATLARQQAS
jgi:phycocyanobilin lyase beta subunit